MKLYQKVENRNGLPATITAASGTVSFNTPKLRGNIVQIYVEPATSTTTYDFYMLDKDSRQVVYYINEVGIANVTSTEAFTPVDGKYTFTIENSSEDENYKVMLIMEE